MKTIAYVLVKTRPGAALQAAERIRAVPSVQTADVVTGVYDVICHVACDGVDALATAVVDRIQQTEGVERTETALVLRPR
jgi:DNA-binding Lrp family transcriptional regulator